MAACLESLHWWDLAFWDDVKQLTPGWAREHSNDDRREFESQVEQMIRDAIPDDLEPLRLSYRQCDWSNPQVHANSDLHRCVIAASYMEEDLTADEVIPQLYGDIPDDLTAPEPCMMMAPTDGLPVIPSSKYRFPVVLTFPKEHLESFIKELKYYAFRTVCSFLMGQTEFLRSLPPTVENLLHEELFRAALVVLMDVLSQDRGQTSNV